MCCFAKIRIFWAIAFSVLALSQALHAYEHLTAFSEPDHCHQNHDHHQQNGPISQSNDCDSSGSECEHSHSPAIINHHATMVVRSSSENPSLQIVSLPDPLARKIDYPPQLS